MPLDGMLGREWLVTNGSAGTRRPPSRASTPASTTACSSPRWRRRCGAWCCSRASRRRVSATAGRTPLACNEYPGTIHPEGYQPCRRSATTRSRAGRTRARGGRSRSSSACSAARTPSASPTRCSAAASARSTLELRAAAGAAAIHELRYQWNGRLAAEAQRTARATASRATSRTPEVFFAHDGRVRAAADWYLNTIYRREQERGYAGLEDLWTPGVVRFTLSPGRPCTSSARPTRSTCTRSIDAGASARRDDGECVTSPRRLVRGDAGGRRPARRFHAGADRRWLAGVHAAPTTCSPTSRGPPSSSSCTAPARTPAGEIRPAARRSANYPWSPPSARAALDRRSPGCSSSPAGSRGRSLLLRWRRSSTAG